MWVFRVLSGQEIAAGQRAHWIWEELPFCVPSVCESYPCAQCVQNTDKRDGHTDQTHTRMKPSQKNASLPSLRKPASKSSDSSIQPLKAQKNQKNITMDVFFAGRPLSAAAARAFSKSASVSPIKLSPPTRRTSRRPHRIAESQVSCTSNILASLASRRHRFHFVGGSIIY